MGCSAARTGHGAGRLAIAAAIATAALVLPSRAAASTAAGGQAPSPPAPSTTTTLPAVPDVPAADTDGQAAQSLLTNALTLSSVGTDDSGLVAAITTTQSKLDVDAQAAQRADQQSDAARSKQQTAEKQAEAASEQYNQLAGAVRQAALYFYMAGPQGLAVSPRAGALALYAQDYMALAVGPYGVLEQRRAAATDRAEETKAASRDAQQAEAAAKLAAKALADEGKEFARLKAELTAVSAGTAAKVTADHVALAGQAGRDLAADSSLQFTPKVAVPAPLSTTSVALSWAFAELGQPYVWGATGPDSFDCSGLTQFVWKAAGVSIPRVAADQYDWTIPVPLSELLPGDLVFFGTTDIHHVGIYIGDGLMINAPHTGTVVQVSSIWWSDLAGFGRVHVAGTPVPAHNTPTPSAPAKAAVVANPGPVPSQTAPPPGWKPKPKETTPIAVDGGQQVAPGPGSPATTTTTSAPTPSTSTTTVPADAPAGADQAGGTTTTSSTSVLGPLPAS